MPTPITLKVFRGSELVRTEQFTREIIKIGRLASAHLCLDDEKISRIHSVIEVAPGRRHLDHRHGQRRGDLRQRQEGLARRAEAGRPDHARRAAHRASRARRRTSAPPVNEAQNVAVDGPGPSLRSPALAAAPKKTNGAAAPAVAAVAAAHAPRDRRVREGGGKPRRGPGRRSRSPSRCPAAGRCARPCARPPSGAPPRPRARRRSSRPPRARSRTSRPSPTSASSCGCCGATRSSTRRPG